MVPIEEKLTVETLATILVNFNSDGIDECEKTTCALTKLG